MINNMIQDFWYGEKNIKVNDFKDKEEQKLFQYLNMFKEGDFNSKNEFVNFFINSKNMQVYNLGMRIFLSIANHKDFSYIQDFLYECEEEQLSVFLAYVQESMSCQSIPYLLALFDIWEDTEVGTDIAINICEMIGYEKCDSELYNSEELGNAFVNFSKKNDLNKYYYLGKEIFLGDLTKMVMSIAVDCKSRNKDFYTDEISSILSNSTGIECPVSFGTNVNEDILHNIMEYINKIAQLGQLEGNKYFYNNVIV